MATNPNRMTSSGRAGRTNQAANRSPSATPSNSSSALPTLATRRVLSTGGCVADYSPHLPPRPVPRFEQPLNCLHGRKLAVGAGSGLLEGRGVDHSDDLDDRDDHGEEGQEEHQNQAPIPFTSSPARSAN
jgi:hypothetical protein